MKGYFGKIIIADLSSGTCRTRDFDEPFARKYIGGNGFAAAIAREMVPPGTGAFDEDNAVVLAAGPFNGSPFYGSGRGHAGGISPQTGMFADSNFGGDFAFSLKAAGFDTVVITGKSDEHVIVVLDEGKASIQKVNSVWGKTISAAHESIISDLGRGFETALIGPAGENGVVYANIMCSGRRVSAAGRCGLGAVLGSKNCKGIAARGGARPGFHDPDRLRVLMKEMLPGLKGQAGALTETGTPVLVNMINRIGKLSTANNRQETFLLAPEISGEVLRDQYKIRNTACRGCPVACGKLVTAEGGKAGLPVKMPEYETIYALGSMLANGSMSSIIKGNHRCDELGMDTISFGVTLAFLAECIEEKLVDSSMPEVPVTFGDADTIERIAEMTALKEGWLGKHLSMGSEKISSAIGGDSYKFLYSVKGLEIAGHSARGLRHMGLGYAVSTRGGSHHDARPQYFADDPEVDPGFEGVPEKIMAQQNNTALGDSLVVCRFIQERVFGMEINKSYLPVINALTGWDIDLDELTAAGERIYTLERQINAERGMDRSMDTLPYRVMNEVIPDGPSKGRACSNENLQAQLDRYYFLRGWDNNGVPAEKTLERLGL